MKIGKQLRKLRKRHNISMVKLSEKSGVQLATISRIENNKMTGTLACHIALTKAMNVDLLELYRDIYRETDSPDAKKAPKQKIFSPSESSSYEILGANISDKKMMPILLKIDPNGKTNEEKNATGVEKFIFVLEGKITLKLGSERFELAQNSSTYIDASLPHVLINKERSPARVLCVSSPVTL